MDISIIQSFTTAADCGNAGRSRYSQSAAVLNNNDEINDPERGNEDVFQGVIIDSASEILCLG
jgi:hypothetical protein